MRAAVARLQEVTENEAAAPKVEASAEEAETISRTLLLAQRTADSTIADSQSEAARIVAQAKNEAAATLDSTREMSAQLIAEARIEARRTADAERQSILSEVEALKARRDFLESDVHHLETFLVDQRSRVREAATSLLELTDRVPGGLGDVRSPLLSASDDDTGEIVVEEPELLIVADAAATRAMAPTTCFAGEPVAGDPPAGIRLPRSSWWTRSSRHPQSISTPNRGAPTIRPRRSRCSAPTATTTSRTTPTTSRSPSTTNAADPGLARASPAVPVGSIAVVSYPDVDPRPHFPQLEEAVLARWAADETFQASIDQRDAGEFGANEFVFYDGPPFANGLPHYGHLLTGYVKDAIPRYQTMRGHRVERRFGWDCHGLPAEVKAEQELGISGHPEITAFGIDRFNEACRSSVLQFTDDWREYVTRQARWVDFDNDYKTLDLTYMESVMWAFKTLWDKGLIYEGFRVIAYCWRCETPLSNTETRMDDVYRDRQDPALTVGFELETGERILAWTTTPWTLPSNLALAVGPDIDYAVVELDGTRYVLAEALLGAYAAELGEATRVDTVRGSDLAGRRYTPLFDYFTDVERFGTQEAFRVLAADFVSTEDGTGVVHMAPGFGEDDQVVANAAGIPTICPMDEHGRYTAEVSDWVGQHVFDANPLVIRHLKDRGVVLRHATYDHPYPHCWRCAQPLVYRAISSWFVQVTAIRDRMVELNQQITWQPAHIKDGSFGKWLENARDWSISRNRFWGSPIPVWQSDDPTYPRTDVYGSLAELEADFGVTVTDLHRPGVDELVRPNPDDPTGKSMMRRVPEVLDCWFESGSMPFARCTTRSRTTNGSSTTIPVTSSWSTSARPAGGSTRCTSSPRRCSTGRRSPTA